MNRARSCAQRESGASEKRVVEDAGSAAKHGSSLADRVPRKAQAGAYENTGETVQGIAKPVRSRLDHPDGGIAYAGDECSHQDAGVPGAGPGIDGHLCSPVQRRTEQHRRLRRIVELRYERGLLLRDIPQCGLSLVGASLGKDVYSEMVQ